MVGEQQNKAEIGNFIIAMAVCFSLIHHSKTAASVKGRERLKLNQKEKVPISKSLRDLLTDYCTDSNLNTIR